MSTRVLVGDAVEVLKTLPAESCHVCVTSPPYYGLRDYGTTPLVWGGDAGHEHEWLTVDELHNRGDATAGPKQKSNVGAVTGRGVVRYGSCPCGAWLGSLGLEPHPDLYIEHLVMVFREVWRVLRPDATLWLNIGDSMAGSGKGKTGANGIGDQEQRQGFHDNYHLERDNQTRARWPDYGKPKDLLLIPFRLAIALQADGWYVRSDVAWCKKSCMPESVQDRPTSAWEHVFLLSKQPRYYYDAEAVRESSEQDDHNQRYAKVYDVTAANAIHRQPGNTNSPDVHARPGPGGRNMRNFWVLGPEPFPSAHFATFVPEIPRRAILAGTSEHGVCPVCAAPWVRVTERASPPDLGRGTQSWAGGAGVGTPQRNSSGGLQPQVPVTTGWQPSCEHVEAIPVAASVLDPFAGAGTTGLVADRLGRDSILIELNPAYAEMARQRITDDSPMFTVLSVPERIKQMDFSA